MSNQPQPKGTVLVVDDDDAVRSGLYWALTSDYQVLQASSRDEACALINDEDIEVVVSDLHLPPHVDDIAEGLALIDVARAQDPPLQVVVITGSDSKRAALEAVKRGAYGFFEKPLDPAELLHIVNQAARMRQLEIENRRLREELSRPPGFTHLMGTSQALERVLKQAKSVAATSATVLLSGENGTGKEMLARAIHQESPRVTGPFVAVSCAALPEALIESELFGHEKGAFTSATQSHKGRFELANGGTLFLDEIGDLSAAVQVKLLRVLQEGEVRRVGSARASRVDVRVLAATNRDLEREVKEGRFREDLYYRLSVVTLRVPPLRERTEDLPLLASNALRQAHEAGARATTISEEALAQLFQYEWPGNVRELENTIAHAALYARGQVITPEDLPAKVRKQPREIEPESKTQSMFTDMPSLDELERRYIIHVLQTVGGSRTRAAEVLGIDRRTLYRMAERFGIKLKESGE